MWEQQGVHWFHLLGSLKSLTIGLIWLVTRGGGVGGVGQGGGQGGVDGGGHQRAGATRRSLVPLVRRGGCGPGRRARGVDGGGHQRAVWEQQGVHWFHFLGSLKNLTIGLIWQVTRGGGVGGVGQPESIRRSLVPPFWASLKT